MQVACAEVFCAAVGWEQDAVPPHCGADHLLMSGVGMCIKTTVQPGMCQTNLPLRWRLHHLVHHVKGVVLGVTGAHQSVSALADLLLCVSCAQVPMVDGDGLDIHCTGFALLVCQDWRAHGLQPQVCC